MPDDNEATITRQFEQEHIDAANTTATTLHDHAVAFDRLANQFPTPTDLSGIVDTAQSRIEHELTGDVDLHRCLDAHNQERTSLLAFKRDKGLIHVPKPQEARLWVFAKLFTLFCAESGGNSAFFAQGSQLGMLGGFFQAAIISAVNVGSGFFVGKLIVPCLRDTVPANRLRALIAVVCGAIVAVGFNLGAAHYRDALAVSTTPLNQSVQTLVRAPLALTFHSFAMLLLGLLIYCIAVWKGSTDDDWFPGHGPRHRQFLAAQDALHEMCRATKARLLAHEASIGHACDEDLRRAGGLLEAMNEVVNAAQQVAGSYDAERSQQEGNRNLAWKRYREENMAVRSTPPPAYFETYEPFPDRVDRAQLLAMTQRTEQCRRSLDELRLKTAEIKGHGPRRVVALERRFREFLKTRTALDVAVIERDTDAFGDDGGRRAQV